MQFFEPFKKTAGGTPAAGVEFIRFTAIQFFEPFKKLPEARQPQVSFKYLNKFLNNDIHIFQLRIFSLLIF
jgi:hypothetical protein